MDWIVASVPMRAMLLTLSVTSTAALVAPTPRTITPRMVATAGFWRPWFRRPALWRVASGSHTEEDAETHPRVRDYMTPVNKLMLLSPDMRIEDAACKLLENGISGAPVVGAGTDDNGPYTPVLLGILSQKDLLYNAAGRGRIRFVTSGPRSQRLATNEGRLRKILDASVDMVMSTRPMTVTADTTMQKAAGLLIDRKISRLPVIDKDSGGLVGLLTITDVIVTVTNRNIGCAIFEE